MNLLFLHGAPASGKLTVAKAILDQVQGRLFDNHAAIDLARTVFDFGAPGFWELVHTARLTVMQAASRGGVRLLVTTVCYSEPEDRAAFEQFESIVEGAGGGVLPVFLSCSREEALRRVGNPDRKARRKISSAAGLDGFLEQWTLVPVARANCLHVDTTSVAPDETARAIISHFGLQA